MCISTSGRKSNYDDVIQNKRAKKEPDYMHEYGFQTDFQMLE